MPESRHSEHEANNPNTAFEPSDVNLRGIVISGTVLGAVSAVIMMAMIWLFDYFAHQTGGAPGPAAQLTNPPMRLPRGPRLEGLEPPETEIQPAIDASHAGYGWVDRQQQIAHIPIEQAMKLLPTKLPAPPPAPAKESQGNKRMAAERTQPPGPSSSGRIVTRGN